MMRRTSIKAKGKPYKPVAVKRHHDRVAALGCLVCGGPATLHHVTGYADRMGRIARDDWRIAPLCPPHHQSVHGPLESVEALGHRGFFEIYGIDLLAVADRLAAETREGNT